MKTDFILKIFLENGKKSYKVEEKLLTIKLLLFPENLEIQWNVIKRDLNLTKAKIYSNSCFLENPNQNQKENGKTEKRKC